MVYVIFGFSALLMIIVGIKLSVYGDTLAAHTKLGHGLIGGILIAGVTSLPELTSSISAAAIGAPDIAFGNVYGSNAFNLMILAIVDLVQGKGSLLRIVRESHILTAMFGILLTGFSVLAVWMSPYGFLELTLGWVSSHSVVLLVLYLFSALLMVRYESKFQTKLETPDPKSSLSVKVNNKEEKYEASEKHEMESAEPEMKNNSLIRAIVGFIAAAAIIVFAGIQLALMADVIAQETGLGQTFVGTLLVAGATSLPELAASVAAIRIGAYDMAVGNVLGSNIFNILILVVTDAAYFSGSVYGVVSNQHLLTAVTTMILSSIAVIGLFYRSRRTIFMLGWDSVAIMIGYLTMMYTLFRISR